MGGVTGLAVMTSGTAVSDTLSSVGPWFWSDGEVSSSNSIVLVVEVAVKVMVFDTHLRGVLAGTAWTVSIVEPLTVTPKVWVTPSVVLSSPLTADSKERLYSSPGVVVTCWKSPPGASVVPAKSMQLALPPWHSQPL